MQSEKTAETVDRALLEEVLSYQKKEARHARISMVASLVLAAAMLLALILAVPKALDISQKAEASLARMDLLVEQVSTLAGEAEVMVSNTNRVVTDNSEAVTEAIAKMNGVDFDRLNEAINDLGDAVKPLAELGKLFNR